MPSGVKVGAVIVGTNTGIKSGVLTVAGSLASVLNVAAGLINAPKSVLSTESIIESLGEGVGGTFTNDSGVR